MNRGMSTSSFSSSKTTSTTSTPSTPSGKTYTRTTSKASLVGPGSYAASSTTSSGVGTNSAAGNFHSTSVRSSRTPSSPAPVKTATTTAVVSTASTPAASTGAAVSSRKSAQDKFNSLLLSNVPDATRKKSTDKDKDKDKSSKRSSKDSKSHRHSGSASTPTATASRSPNVPALSKPAGYAIATTTLKDGPDPPLYRGQIRQKPLKQTERLAALDVTTIPPEVVTLAMKKLSSKDLKHINELMDAASKKKAEPAVRTWAFLCCLPLTRHVV